MLSGRQLREGQLWPWMDMTAPGRRALSRGRAYITPSSVLQKIPLICWARGTDAGTEGPAACGVTSLGCDLHPSSPWSQDGHPTHSSAKPPVCGAPWSHSLHHFWAIAHAASSTWTTFPAVSTWLNSHLLLQESVHGALLLEALHKPPLTRWRALLSAPTAPALPCNSQGGCHRVPREPP